MGEPRPDPSLSDSVFWTPLRTTCLWLHARHLGWLPVIGYMGTRCLLVPTETVPHSPVYTLETARTERGQEAARAENVALWEARPPVSDCPYRAGQPRAQEEPTHRLAGSLALLGVCAASPGGPRAHWSPTTQAAGGTGMLGCLLRPTALSMFPPEEEGRGRRKRSGRTKSDISKLFTVLLFGKLNAYWN